MSQSDNQNPANSLVRRGEGSRIPMSLPILKLDVPEIPGYHLHWMRGDAARLNQAQRAGYTFVEQDEVDLVATGLADDANASGNTDLGTRVSISAGGNDEQGQNQRLYLMKLPLEYWEEDQKALEDRNEQIAAALRGGTPEGTAIEGAYIPEAHRKQVANLFTPKR